MDEKIVKIIWNKCKTINGKDDKLYRIDKNNNVLYFPSYGKNSDMGWMITKVDGRKNLEENNLHAICKQCTKKQSKKAK